MKIKKEIGTITFEPIGLSIGGSKLELEFDTIEDYNKYKEKETEDLEKLSELFFDKFENALKETTGQRSQKNESLEDILRKFRTSAPNIKLAPSEEETEMEVPVPTLPEGIRLTPSAEIDEDDEDYDEVEDDDNYDEDSDDDCSTCEAKNICEDSTVKSNNNLPRGFRLVPSNIEEPKEENMEEDENSDPEQPFSGQLLFDQIFGKRELKNEYDE